MYVGIAHNNTTNKEEHYTNTICSTHTHTQLFTFKQTVGSWIGADGAKQCIVVYCAKFGNAVHTYINDFVDGPVAQWGS